MKSKLLISLLVWPLFASLSACGFQPLYGQQKGGVDINEKLKDIFVANIGGGRFGQVLRLALQSNMAADGPENPTGYILRVNGGMSYQYTDIHGDNTAGHIQATGYAQWKLYKFGEKEKLVAHGAARSLDGFDSTLNEYFAQTLESEKMEARVAHNLANEMSQQVAIYFKKHISPTAITRDNTATYMDPDAAEVNGAEVQHAGPDGVPDDATGRMSKSISTQSQE